MPGIDPLHSSAVVNLLGLPRLGSTQLAYLRDLLTAIDQNSDIPVRLSATFPTADANLQLSPSRQQESDGGEQVSGPLAAVIPSFLGAAVNFQTGAITGSGASQVQITIPVVPLNHYVRAGVTLLSSGVVEFIFSADKEFIASLADPGTVFDFAGTPRGWLDLQCTAAGQFKTIGSASNIIENAPGGTAAIHRITAGTPHSGMVDPIASINQILTTETGDVVVDSSGNLTLSGY